MRVDAQLLLVDQLRKLQLMDGEQQQTFIGLEVLFWAGKLGLN